MDNSLLNLKKLFIMFSLFLLVISSFIVIAQEQDSSSDSSISQNTVSTEQDSSSDSSISQNDIYVNIDDLSEQLKNYDEINISSQENISSNDNASLVNETFTNDIFLESAYPISSSNAQDYQYLDLSKIEGISNSANVSIDNLSSSKIDYVLYRGNKKEVETITFEDSNLEITTDEKIFSGQNWKKQISIFSNKHHEEEVKIYSDVPISLVSQIKVFWKEEKEFINFSTGEDYSTDRISWIVPHLSEQNFEITISPKISVSSLSLTTQDSNENSSQIIISSVIYPSNSSNSKANFSFIVNNTANNVSICNFSLFKSYNLINSSIFNVAAINYSFSVNLGSYYWNLSCSDLNNNLTNFSEGIFSSTYIDPPKVNLTSNVNKIFKGVPITFFVNISSSVSPIQYILDWGDNTSVLNPGSLNLFNITNYINHTYLVGGTYSAVLTAFINGLSYQQTLVIFVNSTPLNFTDSVRPQVILNSPNNDETIVSEYILFSYFANDNVKVANCTLNVYSYENNSILGTSVYSNLEDNAHNMTVSLNLTDFDNGDYS